ncbi:MAG: tetratricopeptide repeat protein [Parabacteroides sp.]|nr:tetratricopeptide repeat protein [Parabacteroides sp.]
MKLSNPTYCNLSIIHRSILLSTSGYFSESIQNLEQIDSQTLDKTTRVEYYTVYEWAYSMWAEYSNDKVYAPRYYEKEMLYQDSLISVLPASSSLHHYWKGENLFRHQRYAEAEDCYKKALEGVPVNVRLYAMATYGLALVYAKRGNWEMYEQYLIKAASPTKYAR